LNLLNKCSEFFGLFLDSGVFGEEKISVFWRVRVMLRAQTLDVIASARDRLQNPSVVFQFHDVLLFLF
jgi:hypothetical protein